MERTQGYRLPTILYAGTQPERVEVLADTLRANDVDCNVQTAESIEHAVAIAEDRHLAALVVESDLPDGGALEAIDRCLEEQSDLLTMVLTDQGSPFLVDRAYDLGVDELVQTSGDAAFRVVQRELADYLDKETVAAQSKPGRHVETLAATTSDAIISIDERSIIRYANPAVEEIFGYEPAALVGEPITLLMRDELAEDHREGMRQYIESGEQTLNWNDIELPGQHKDGHEIPLSISFSEFMIDSDHYFTGVIRDIRERKQIEAERELYHDVTQQILQAESFESGLQIAVDAIGSEMNWECGEAWIPLEDDRLERVSEGYAATDTAEEFLEVTSQISFDRGEGLIGRVWESGSHEWITDLTAADAPFKREDAAEWAEFGTALAVPIVSDDTIVAVIMFFLTESREPDEAMVHATRTIAADLGHLMQRLEAESTVRKERRLKDRILETSPVGIVILRPDGRFQYVNDRASEILGLDESESSFSYERLDVELLSFEGDDATGARPDKRVIEDGEDVSGEARIEVDGETRWLAVNGAPLHGEAGDVTSAVFSLRDVTDRKERERQLKQYETVMQTLSDGVYALDEAGRFVLVNDAYVDLLGYERSELLGEPAREFVPDRLVDEAYSLHERSQEGDTDEATLETTISTASGDQVPIEVRFVAFELSDGSHGRVGVVRDITRRKRREERLAQLNEIGQSLTTAETRVEVADIVVEGASEVLDLPLTALEYYDEDAGELRVGAMTPELRDLVSDASVFESEQNVAWLAFSSHEERTIPDLSAETAVAADETPLESAMVFPIGGHGVFIAGATTPDAFSDTDVQAARILVGNALAALDRVGREQELREKKEALQEHNKSLERVNRLNSIIRNLTRELTHASTREEIEQAVCEELSSASPYVFSWIGEQQAVSDEIEPRTWAGREDGYLDAITATATEDESGTGPAGITVQTQEPAVQNNLQSDPPFESWRTEALRRDYRSNVAIPLTYRDTMYGLLSLYADETGVFDEMEVAVLTELGEMIGYAINAIERRKALVSDAAVELRFELDDQSIPAIQFATERNARFEFETLVEQSDSTIRVFFTVAGVDPDAIHEFVAHAGTIEDVSLIAELDDRYRYEAVVSRSGFLGELLSYGAHPTEMTATSSHGQLTLEFPRSGDIKSFTRMFTRKYDGAQLVSRKQYDRPVQTREEFEANYKERLTERQREVLQTAYFSGFFEWPRAISGTELAEKLKVSQPTVSRHIRNGERKLFDIVFDDGQ